MFGIAINPWTIIKWAVVTVLVASGWIAFSVERIALKDLQLAVEKQKTEAAELLGFKIAENAAIQHRFDEINLKVETEHAEHQAAIGAAAAENQRLAAQLVRLLDQSGSGPRGDGALPGAAHPAAGSSELCPAYRRLTRLVAELLTRGNQLDAKFHEQAAAATECHDWAVEVSAVPR